MRTEKIFDQKKFEDLLVLKWTEFIDGSKLIELISRLVEDNRDSFEHVVNTKYKKKSIQIMVSRFQMASHGFTIWIDFLVPLQKDQVAVGTTEMFLLSNGILSVSKTLGNIFGSD
jgi:hypothetical protein